MKNLTATKKNGVETKLFQPRLNFDVCCPHRKCTGWVQPSYADKESNDNLFSRLERAGLPCERYLPLFLARASRSPPLMPAMYRTTFLRASMSYWEVMAICSMMGEPPPW